MVQAVLVGCGAMSKAWLEAARQTDGVTIAGLVDLDADARRGAGARSSTSTTWRSAPTSTRSSSRPGRMWCSTWSCLRRGAMWRSRPSPTAATF